MEENRKNMTDLPFQIEGSLNKLFIGADIIKNKNYNEIEFLVDKLIPRGTLCALVGESDTGKSSLLRQLALSLVYGDSEFLGFKLQESCRNVVYVSTEDGEMATSAWLNKYFGDEFPNDSLLSKLKYLYETDGVIKNLEKVVKNNCVDLIIIDSYADLFTGSMNNSNEVRTFLNAYNAIANKYGVTVIFLHHTRKDSSGMVPNKNSILGSQGFEAKMRSVLMLTKDSQDDSLRHLCIVKNNYLPDEVKSMSYILRFNEQLSFENTGKRTKLDDISSEPWIEEAKKMKEDGLSFREISDQLEKIGYKVSKSKVQRRL